MMWMMWLSNETCVKFTSIHTYSEKSRHVEESYLYICFTEGCLHKPVRNLMCLRCWSKAILKHFNTFRHLSTHVDTMSTPFWNMSTHFETLSTCVDMCRQVPKCVEMSQNGFWSHLRHFKDMLKHFDTFRHMSTPFWKISTHFGTCRHMSTLCRHHFETCQHIWEHCQHIWAHVDMCRQVPKCVEMSLNGFWSHLRHIKAILKHFDTFRDMSAHVDMCRHMLTHCRHMSTCVDTCRHVSTCVDMYCRFCRS